MKKDMLQKLYIWPKPYLTGTDLFHLYDKSDDSRYSLIKRAVQDDVLIHLRRDLYLIKPQVDKIPPDAFEIAHLIYGPSYISLESALSFHGWIPEGVQVTTSVCSKRKNVFQTPIGVFTYERIPTSAFHFGVKEHVLNQSVTLIAEPWKALSDLF